jgi:hypothetical protein
MGRLQSLTYTIFYQLKVGEHTEAETRDERWLIDDILQKAETKGKQFRFERTKSGLKITRLPDLPKATRQKPKFVREWTHEGVDLKIEERTYYVVHYGENRSTQTPQRELPFHYISDATASAEGEVDNSKRSDEITAKLAANR